MEISTIVSNRGKILLQVNSFTFSQDKTLKSGETYWRCVKRSCKAKIFTMGPEKLVIRSDLEHNHECDIKTLNRQIVRSSAKRKAMDNLNERPSKIIHSALKENVGCMSHMTVKDVNLIRNQIYSGRRMAQPKLPKSKEETIAAVNIMNIRTLKDENLIFAVEPSSNIIIFSCDTNMRFLCGSETIYMDGTFSYCAQYFKQLFTLHVYINGHYIPLCYCLLPDKAEQTYVKLFNTLKSKCDEVVGLKFDPKIIFSDFEIAIHNAARFVFPNVRIKGCRFHLMQAWYRYIGSCGLIREYKFADSEISKWLKYIFGLPFLPPLEVEESFIFDFMAIQPKDTRIEKFSDYILDNYIGDHATFPPEMWATLSESLELTTNACESFHSRFNDNFYHSHPNIFHFIDVLKNFQTETYIKINSVHENNRLKDPKSRKKLIFVRDRINEFRTNRIDRFHFVKCMSHLFQK